VLLAEMEMKKLHMGTMSYGFDSMDEVSHQLAMAFGATAEQSRHNGHTFFFFH
jgi:phospholipid-translocating ATPase